MIKIEIYLALHYSEQRAIAAVLSDMDAEIAALEKRRDKIRALKRGMMQQLLTGRVRLVPPDGHIVERNALSWHQTSPPCLIISSLLGKAKSLSSNR